jgi:RNA polymerase sigma factor for flagellar operon FliA
MASNADCPEGSPPALRADPKREKRLEKLWRSYRRRPSAALRNSLVEEYQDLVEDTVRRFAGRLPRSVDPGDLNTAANFGLMSAIESFDPERGVRFETYGELRIKGALLDELRTQDWLPRPWRSRIERHKRALERLRSEQNPEPSDEEVARAMSIPMQEYRQFFGNGVPNAPTGSMPATEGAEELPGLDVFPDPKSDAAAEKLTRDELLQLVAQKLTEQEYRIVYLKYWEELPMREIGQLEGLSESRVCKIHTKLIERLRERLRANAPG